MATTVRALHLPYYFAGSVVSGFGRGGKELGCPTANMDDAVVSNLPSDFATGVYYGYSRIDHQQMVMSVGWNPHYQNERKTVEVHVLHPFTTDFYGSHMEVVVLGYIRDMTSFKGLEELKLAIANDISYAKEMLEKTDREATVAEYFKPKGHL